MSVKPKIVFMGTPEFAVPSLNILLENGYNVVGVITAPDKPAGRGMKLNESPVKQFAISKGLKILQPEKLKDLQFLEEYKALDADLNIVVAFRMLPEVIWSAPRLGTFNLHASLLPQYRGAAPINWAIINGEKTSGITTFLIDREIDTGKIILQEEVNISDSDTAGDLHDKLMEKGAVLVLKTVKLLENGGADLIDQSQITQNQNIKLKPAPKIFKNDCEISLNSPLSGVYNKIRGLSPYPSASLMLTDKDGNDLLVKIYDSDYELFENKKEPGSIETDGKNFIAVNHPEGQLFLKEIQIPGRKKLGIHEFLRGYSLLTGDWKVKHQYS